MKRFNDAPIYFLVLLVACCRLAPHPPGFTPIGALGLFSGAYMTRYWTWLAPLAALAIGDAVMGFYQPLIMASVYLGFLLATCVGRMMLRKRRSVKRVAGAIVIAALIFFVVTNGSSWWVFYPHTLAGLITCYLNGLPYLGVALLADSCYAALMFGGYEYWRRQRAMPVAVAR